MTSPVRAMGKLEVNQPVGWRSVPVRFGVLTLIKTAPPAAKPHGVIGPLAYIYMCPHKYTYILTHIYTYIYIRIHPHLYIHTYIHIYFYAYVYIQAHAYIRIYIYTHIHTPTHLHIYICTHLHIHVYIYIPICIHIHICIYIYSQSHLGWHLRMLLQSSKLKARTPLFTETWQKSRSSFESRALENDNPSGTGCYDTNFRVRNCANMKPNAS